VESIGLLIMLLVVAACAVVVAAQIFRWRTQKRLSPRSWLIAGIALLPIALVIGSAVESAGKEYNPRDATSLRIAGHYTHGEASLTLRLDGTYTSHNIAGLTAGTWTHFDWNLTFSGSTLEQPRWITRRGRPAILPYYSGADGSDGPLFRKRSPAE
jgi:hypothetical protein